MNLKIQHMVFSTWFQLLISSCCILLQAFWPSLMMKKWLNIKPKEYDFSADEVDTETETETETESEDYGMVSWSQLCTLQHYVSRVSSA